MKVMCIDDHWVELDGSKSNTNDPSFGEIVTVVETKNNWGFMVYILLEYPYKGGYSVKNFAPLSDKDETETEVYKNLQTQTV